jgi:uncharacterized protein (DUF1499 family)
MRNGFVVRCTLGCILPLLVCCGGNPSGLAPGPLNACPDSPNCVSSMDPREKHAVEPLRYAGDWTAARDRLVSLLAGMKRTRVVAVQEKYIHAECRSRIFRFVDDLEFYFVPEAEVIHVRSAARTGYSDFGVNRKRVEEIRQLWANKRQ